MAQGTLMVGNHAHMLLSIRKNMFYFKLKVCFAQVKVCKVSAVEQ